MSIAHELKLTPQAKTVLKHLEGRLGAITPMEALVSYGISRLAATIYEIRRAGHEVNAKIKMDEAGHRYTKYSLAKKNT